LSDHAREQIRKWPHELDLQLSVGKGFMLQIPALDDPSTAGVRAGNALDASLQFATNCSKWFGSMLRESLHSAPKDGMAESRAPRFKSRHNEWKRGFSYALPVMIVVIMISILLPNIHHRERRESLVELGAKNAGEVRPQPIGETAVSNALLPAPDIGHASAEKSKVDSTLEPVNPQPASAASPVISNSKKSEPPAAQAPAANVSAPAPVAPGGKLVVQVAALTRETDARKLADSLRGKNFEAFVGTLPVDALYRVMVGPYANEASALVAVDKLKKAGIASFVRRESGVVVAGSSVVRTP
jgi:cell division septation protein DedD